MAAHPPSLRDVAATAEAMTRAADVATAFRTAAAEAARLLHTSAWLFENTERGWTLMASTHELAHDALAAAYAALDRIARADSPVLLHHAGAVTWTSVSLPPMEGPQVAVLLDGDLSDRRAAVTTWISLTALAIHAVRERDARRQADGLLLDGYATARRLSRPGSVESVCQRIVDHVARLLEAERIALAVYQPMEDCLVIEATSGYPVSSVKDVRIEPGSWVIGHVFSTRRPVFVRDVRHIRGMARGRQQYRTYSFAAVPLLSGSQTVGVLTATDKTNGSPLGRRDLLVMRTVSAVAAMAIVAARSQNEAGRLAYAATVDSLTALLNRPYLDARLHQEVERARRGSNSLAVLMADIDDFKSVNDTYGHQGGDAVLRAIGEILRSAVRIFDVCARYGGDEFAILMPNTDRKDALACGERIRRRVAEYRSAEEPAAQLPPLTMSVGVAVIESGDTPATLLRRADRCLYQAKADGKNRVRMHPSVPNGQPLRPTSENEQGSI